MEINLIEKIFIEHFYVTIALLSKIIFSSPHLLFAEEGRGYLIYPSGIP